MREVLIRLDAKILARRDREVLLEPGAGFLFRKSSVLAFWVIAVTVHAINEGFSCHHSPFTDISA